MSEGPVDGVSDKEMREFCASVGELIFWASFVDAQINKVFAAVMVLPDHVLIEPIIGQLDARQKIEILKKRAKLFSEVTWKNALQKWLKSTEKVNSYRNVVAHHSVSSREGKIELYSDQMGKILASLEPRDGAIKPKQRHNASDVATWVEFARRTHNSGEELIATLDHFRTYALTRLGHQP